MREEHQNEVLMGSRAGHTIFLAPKVTAGDIYYVKLNSEQLSFYWSPLKNRSLVGRIASEVLAFSGRFRVKKGFWGPCRPPKIFFSLIFNILSIYVDFQLSNMLLLVILSLH